MARARAPHLPVLTRAAARARALAATGLGRRPRTAPTRAQVAAVVARLGVVQIDSISVLVRAHYLPAFSRLGPYDRAHLDRLAYEDRVVFEQWGHEASLLPVELHPLLRWRMEAKRPWPSVAALLRDDALVARVDLKADRAREALVVRSTRFEPGAEADAVAPALAAELGELAGWLGLPRVVVAPRGTHHGVLRAATRTRASRP